MTTNDWETIASNKRASVAALIPPKWLVAKENLPTEDRLDVTSFPSESGVLTEKEVEITESLSATELVDKIAKGVYSSVEVTTAFCKRAVIAHQLVSSPICIRPTSSRIARRCK